MDLVQFHKMRTAIQENAFPGSGTDVADVEGRLRDLLMNSGLFDSVEVDHTDDPDQLVIALCEFRRHLDEAAIAGQLERIWDDRVRYPFWEAHALVVDREHVEFEAATRHSSGGHYVTVHLVAKKARIPSQRVQTD